VKKFLTIGAFGLAVALQGCTTHLASGQKNEYRTYEEKGLLVKERSVGTAGLLGILPVAGYAYAGNYVLAVTTIPLYPFLGPLWMPFDAAASVKTRNYYATRAEVERQKAKALRELDHKLEDRTLTYEQHIREQRAIEARYSAY
jgi:small-conductance mechanosensitive channel